MSAAANQLQQNVIRVRHTSRGFPLVPEFRYNLPGGSKNNLIGGHVLNCFDDLTVGLVLFWALASFTLAPTFET